MAGDQSADGQQEAEAPSGHPHPEVGNDVSGSVKGTMVQAGAILGGVHVHTSATGSAGGGPRQHPRLRTTALVITGVVAFAAAVLVIVWPRGAPPTPATGALGEGAAPATAGAQLQVVTLWPLNRGCDGTTAVAMPPGGSDFTTFSAGSEDLRLDMIAAGAGSWRSGTLYLDLASKDDTPVQILDLRPRINPRQLPAPRWIYSPNGGCGSGQDRCSTSTWTLPPWRTGESWVSQKAATGDRRAPNRSVRPSP